jgi:hypothetical protein
MNVKDVSLGAALVVAVMLAGCEPAPTALPPPATRPAPAASEEPGDVAPGMVRDKAEVGVGSRGRDYEPGLVTTPIQSYFRMQERITFDVQLKQSMDAFQAIEGRAPKSHAEFMEKIVKAGGINLPPLPDGHKYVYDPAVGQLMVERPQ